MWRCRDDCPYGYLYGVGSFAWGEIRLGVEKGKREGLGRSRA